jgi:7,8-dihydropterin-6-yl-methyl-4-(beta-D-ribofuranosyl)aminobenzene 5'-phosphate synthase
MLPSALSLPEVDEVKLTLVMDNSIDLLMAGSDVARRFPLRKDLFGQRLPMAEHGFSAMLQVRRGQANGTVIFDTGVTRAGLLHNLDALEIETRDIQAIILSHGHADHAMGLPGLVERLGTRGLPLVLHPDAYLERRLVLPNGAEISLPAPKVADFRRENIEIIEAVGPSMLVDNMVLVSGEVGRTTEFEKGFAAHQALRHGHWEPDPLISDDQCAVMNVRGKGLVIVTGCGHAGIINIIRHAQALTGVTRIYAVVGGFHLTGNAFLPIIAPTIRALEEIQPRYVMPGHCTGWVAMHQIARALPEAFIANSVGTTLIL